MAAPLVIAGVALTATEIALIFTAAVALGYIATNSNDIRDQLGALTRLSWGELFAAWTFAHEGSPQLQPRPQRPTAPLPSNAGQFTARGMAEQFRRKKERRRTIIQRRSMVRIYRAPRTENGACEIQNYGRFWAPPLFRHVAEEYATRSGYCGMIREVHIPGDVYVTKYWQYERSLDGGNVELEFPARFPWGTSVKQEMSQYPQQLVPPRTR